MNAKIDLTGVQIPTARLLLREWREADAADLFAISSQPYAEEMIGRPRHKSLAEAQQAIADYAAKKNCFALQHVQDSKVIGFLELHGSWAARDPRFAHLSVTELGTFLAEEYWGGGYAAEASQAAIDYCFDVLQLGAVAVCHFVTNGQSQRVVEKLGFRFMQEDSFHSRALDRDFLERQYILLREDAADWGFCRPDR